MSARQRPTACPGILLTDQVPVRQAMGTHARRRWRARTVLAQAGAGPAGGPDADPDEVEPGFEPVWPEAEAGPFGEVAGLG